jgi:hypothetical protein
VGVLDRAQRKSLRRAITKLSARSTRRIHSA